MEQNQQAHRHLKSFWAIVVVLVVALIAGGLIYWYQFNYAYDEDMHALELRILPRSQNQQKQLPAAATTAPVR